MLLTMLYGKCFTEREDLSKKNWHTALFIATWSINWNLLNKRWYFSHFSHRNWHSRALTNALTNAHTSVRIMIYSFSKEIFRPIFVPIANKFFKLLYYYQFHTSFSNIKKKYKIVIRCSNPCQNIKRFHSVNTAFGMWSQSIWTSYSCIWWK